MISITTHLDDDLFPNDSTVTSFFQRTLALWSYVEHVYSHSDQVYEWDGPIKKINLTCDNDIKKILNQPNQKYKKFNYDYERIRVQIYILYEQRIITIYRDLKNGSKHKKNYFSLGHLKTIETMWDSGVATIFRVILNNLVSRYEQLPRTKRVIMLNLLRTKAPWMDARKLNGSNGQGNYLEYYAGSNTLENLVAIGMDDSRKIREFYYELRMLYHCVVKILRILHPDYTKKIEPTIIQEQETLVPLL